MLNINKKKVPVTMILVSMTVAIIIFMVMVVQYNNAVMPKTLKTNEIDSLEKALVEDYVEVRGLEVKDVGGVELSILVLLN